MTRGRRAGRGNSEARAPKRDSQTLTGRLSVHRRGFGFVIPDDPTSKGDVYVAASRMGGAADGDQVRVRLLTARRRGRKNALEGEVVEVLARGRETVIGKILRYRKEVYLAPLDERYQYMVHLVDDRSAAVPAGKVVLASIVAHPGRDSPPLGELREVLGDADDPEIQYKIVCHQYEIPIEFSAAALAETEAAQEPDETELSRREDLRDLLTVTIDGETARDFDDAVSIRKGTKGFRLWVHIADVSHYVLPGSALDEAALERGTSVYFPDRAVPMLPERLSNGLCSLKPRVDRLTMTARMDLDEEGRVQASRFFRSVIRSDRRMTYTEVARILSDGNAEERTHSAPLVESLGWMLELSQILRKRRAARGALDFDLPEAEIEYDVNGDILDIVRSERNEAHRLIEEFMLLANEAVASFLDESEIPLIYRIHEEPDQEKVETFREIAAPLGYSLQGDGKGGYSVRAFQKLTSQLAGKPEERFLSYLMLRSFKQAQYSAVNLGHFGLASSCYTHFTSPIRRYPDLIIHRVLKLLLDAGASGPAGRDLFSRLEAIALQSSRRERAAVEAEREIMKWLMAEFMSSRLGEEYEGFVTGVRRNGFFVELLEHFVEGFVPVETLVDDYYVYNSRHHCLIGENRKKVFRLGESIRVRVDKVSRDRHLVEFSPAPPEEPAGKKRRR